MFKLRFLLSTITCIFFITQTNAKIWRVNNNASVTAHFTSLSAANASSTVQPGDTLHLEGSPTSYGAVTITKKLIIIGPGYLLNENLNLQAVALSAKVDAIGVNASAAGTVFLGLDFQSNSLNIYSSDIVVRRCRFNDAGDYYLGQINVWYHNTNSGIPASNIIIAENYAVSIAIHYPSTGILITNNFITRPGYEGEATGNDCILMNANAVALIQNNIFRKGRVNANNSNLTNNIMYNGTLGGSGNLISNNIGNGTQFGTANGNQESVVMTTVFLGAGPGISRDKQWQLKTTSPAVGAGFGSTGANPIDCGIYGGAKPYVLSGVPPIPAIYSFTNQPIGSNNDPIDVTIKVRSNN